jgi:ParB-like chromosome segregation protein Spo0J
MKTKTAPAAIQVETIPTADLIPYARNSRTHSPEQTAQIAGSIREFGFTNPVLIDAENGIIAGHGRVMAAQKLGLDKVPCIRLAHLTETQKRAYIIADNQLGLNSGWNEEMLGLELADLRDADFDLRLIGFDAESLSDLLNNIDLEGITAEHGDSAGDGIECLVIGKYRIPLELDEVNALTGVVQAYAEERGTTMGFGSYLLRKIEQ